MYTHRVAIADFSGVHSIMIGKSALAGEGGECTPTPFQAKICSAFTPPISSLRLYVWRKEMQEKARYRL